VAAHPHRRRAGRLAHPRPAPHAFASVAASSGAALPIIGKLLGHTQAATTQRYAHPAADPVKAAAQDVASRIAAAMKSGGKRAVVIRFPAN
jgi:site-specific recombinase XerD